MAREFTYEIVEEIKVLSRSAKDWTKEINLVSYNGAKPKFDIRDWAPERESMGKGITLTEDEASALRVTLDNYFGDKTIVSEWSPREEFSGKIEFQEISVLFENYSIWHNSHEMYMYEWLWELLDQSGLTTYKDKREYYLIHIYALVLLKFYDEFSMLAFDELAGFDDNCEEIIEDFIPEHIIGELYGELSSDPFTDTLSTMIIFLVDEYHISIMDRIRKRIGFGLYPILFGASHTFTELVFEEDEDGELRDDEVEMEINSLEDYKKAVDGIAESLFDEAYSIYADAFYWAENW